VADVKAALGRFMHRVLHHPAVLCSPASVQAHLAFEVQSFLLAHISHAEANHRFRAQQVHAPQPSNDRNADGRGADCATKLPRQLQHHCHSGQSLHHWLRSTSADSNGASFPMLFFICLVHHAALGYPRPADASSTSSASPPIGTGICNYGDRLSPLTASARAAYLSEDATRHLAALRRLYTDAGSAARDAAEGTLNALDFPEFALLESASAAAGRKGRGQSPRDELLWIAEYEWRGLQTALDALQQELEEVAAAAAAAGHTGGGRWAAEWMGALRMFARLTALYGLVYVQKDLSNRLC
jgi:hypothetical protein